MHVQITKYMYINVKVAWLKSTVPLVREAFDFKSPSSGIHQGVFD